MAIWLDGLQAVLEVFVELLTSVFFFLETHKETTGEKEKKNLFYDLQTAEKSFWMRRLADIKRKSAAKQTNEMTSISQTLNQLRNTFYTLLVSKYKKLLSVSLVLKLHS